MRDLERLQDVVEYRVNPSQLRVVFLGVLAVTCAIFAVGVTVGKRLEPGNTVLAVDPLAELDRARGSTVDDSDEESNPPALTYHEELTDRDAVRRRRAPEPESAAEEPARPPQPREVAASRTPERPSPQPAPAAAPQPPASSPVPAAAVAPPEPERLPEEPAHPERPQPGESSVFTLQVASFETREEAAQFAADLRGHGHRVFLVRTGTPDRGTWFRVRVGPFFSRRDAVRYQRRFERQERLPTFLVQRRTR